MMKNKILVLGLFLLGSFSLFSQGVTHINFPVEYVANFCDDGPALVKADFHFIIHETEAASGNYQFKFTLNGKGTAEGIENDKKYLWSNNYTYSYHAAQGESESLVQIFNITGKGDAANLKGKIMWRFQVNANGQLTVDIDSFEVNCH
jgi:hypothetical protein